MSTQSLFEQIQALSVDEIRKRLIQLDGERQALGLLLRARLASDKRLAALSRGSQLHEEKP